MSRLLFEQEVEGELRIGDGLDATLRRIEQADAACSTCGIAYCLEHEREEYMLDDAELDFALRLASPIPRGLDGSLHRYDVNDATLQPSNAQPRTSRSGRRGRSPRRRSGVPGRPTLDDEARDRRFSARTTRQDGDVLDRAFGGNASTALHLIARVLESGDVTPVVELIAELDVTPENLV